MFGRLYILRWEVVSEVSHSHAKKNIFTLCGLKEREGKRRESKGKGVNGMKTKLRECEGKGSKTKQIKEKHGLP